MSTIRRIVCLANSRKISGRCIAGKEILADGIGGWIRPVSERATGEISEEERRYADGASAQVLDLIDIPIVRPAVGGHQTENYLIDPCEHWKRAGALPRTALAHFADHPESLWKVGDSTLGGQNDRVRMDTSVTFAGSLYLIVPERLTLHVVSETVGIIQIRRRVRASFFYRETRYDIAVTDPIAERGFLTKPDGEYALDASCICVSLSETYRDGYSYKLVATII